MANSFLLARTPKLRLAHLKRRLPTGYPPFIPFALLNYVTHSEKE
jgi:hypothetical protein